MIAKVRETKLSGESSRDPPVRPYVKIAEDDARARDVNGLEEILIDQPDRLRPALPVCRAKVHIEDMQKLRAYAQVRTEQSPFLPTGNTQIDVPGAFNGLRLNVTFAVDSAAMLPGFFYRMRISELVREIASLVVLDRTAFVAHYLLQGYDVSVDLGEDLTDAFHAKAAIESPAFVNVVGRMRNRVIVTPDSQSATPASLWFAAMRRAASTRRVEFVHIAQDQLENPTGASLSAMGHENRRWFLRSTRTNDYQNSSCQPWPTRRPPAWFSGGAWWVIFVDFDPGFQQSSIKSDTVLSSPPGGAAFVRREPGRAQDSGEQPPAFGWMHRAVLRQRGRRCGAAPGPRVSARPAPRRHSLALGPLLAGIVRRVHCSGSLEPHPPQQEADSGNSARRLWNSRSDPGMRASECEDGDQARHEHCEQRTTFPHPILDLLCSFTSQAAIR